MTMAGADYSGMGDFISMQQSKAASQKQFLDGIRQRQEENNARVIKSTTAIVAGVLGWSAYKRYKNARRP
jgi:hypothetical protein